MTTKLNSKLRVGNCFYKQVRFEPGELLEDACYVTRRCWVKYIRNFHIHYEDDNGGSYFTTLHILQNPKYPHLKYFNSRGRALAYAKHKLGIQPYTPNS